MAEKGKKQLAGGNVGPESLDAKQRILFFGLAESDLVQAGEAIDAALKLVGKNKWLPCSTYLALADAALLRYARPFTGNRMPGLKQKVALPLSYLPAIEGIAAFHLSLMELRHEFGAHSDMTKRDLWIERLTVPEGEARWRGHAMCAWMTPPQLVQLRRVAYDTAARLKMELSTLADATFLSACAGQKVQISPVQAPVSK